MAFHRSLLTAASSRIASSWAFDEQSHRQRRQIGSFVSADSEGGEWRVSVVAAVSRAGLMNANCKGLKMELTGRMEAFLESTSSVEELFWWKWKDRSSFAWQLSVWRGQLCTSGAWNDGACLCLSARLCVSEWTSLSHRPKQFFWAPSVFLPPLVENGRCLSENQTSGLLVFVNPAVKLWVSLETAGWK